MKPRGLYLLLCIVGTVVPGSQLVWVEGHRAPVRHAWAPVAGSLVVGVSLGLPLFLFLREGARARGIDRVESAAR